ncbi:MAG: relaxase domain-containing protein [Phycisphaerales bacterium]|nr:relaxase domain-containing protein [Phycisphaerales bacterium]
MLRITTRTSASAATRYYTGADPGAQEYLSENSATSGLWGGKATEWLGLEGTVDRDDFTCLANNIDPLTRGRLTVRMKAHRRIGFDFNFNPCKSLSVMYALTKDPRILAAYERAVDETMREIEADATTRHRRDGFNCDAHTGNLVWAKYTHFTTRPINGVPDPHLHSHVFVFNVTYDPDEKRWKALQVGNLKQDAPAYQAFFHDRLATHLRELGFKTYKRGLSFEIEGIPEHLLRGFSKRTRSIEQAADKLGIKNPKARSNVGARTREAKRAGLSEHELEEQWRSSIPAHDRAQVEVLVHAPKSPAQPIGSRDPVLIAQALEYAKERSFERRSLVSENHFLATARQWSMGTIDPSALRVVARADTQFIRTTDEMGNHFYTTHEVLNEERSIVGWAKHGRGTCLPLAANCPASSTSGLDDSEMVAALNHIATSKDRVIGVVGVSGSGKTTMLKTAIPAIRDAGTRVAVLAPTAVASRGTLRKAGFDEAETVERFLNSDSMQQSARNGVIWVDEASFLATRDVARLFECASKLDARVILSGDTRQHRAVQRGDAFRTLIEHGGIEPVHITKIKRQQGIYREAMEQLANRKLEDVFRTLDQMGAIAEHDEEHIYAAFAVEYVQGIKAGQKAGIVCPTHAEGRAVTSAVRQALVNEGLIHDERTVPILRRVDLHAADQRLPRTYVPGWVVEVVRPNGQFPVGQRLLVTSTDENGVRARNARGDEVVLNVESLGGCLQVYTRAEVSVGIGDHIRITKNGSAQDRSILTNPEIYTVAGFTAGGDIVLNDGRTVSKHYGHLDHGWCITSYAAQSKTLDWIYVVEGRESFPAASWEQFYVSTSRGRQGLWIFTTDKEGLMEAVQQSSQRAAALDLEIETGKTSKLIGGVVSAERLVVDRDINNGRRREFEQEH